MAAKKPKLKVNTKGLGIGAPVTAALKPPPAFVNPPGSPPIGGLVGSPSLVNPGPAPQPIPPDPFLENSKLTANRNIALGTGEAAWQQGQLQRSSGFDASGNLVTSGADFSPFSQAMQLQDTYKASKLGTNTSYAGQGQLYSGAYGRAQLHNDTGYARSFDALKTGAQAGYHGIQSGLLGTYANNSLGTGTQSFESLLKQLYGG